MGPSKPRLEVFLCFNFSAPYTSNCHMLAQPALNEESSYLTTFLSPSVCYRYLRVPMGLSSSSEVLMFWFCYRRILLCHKNLRWYSHLDALCGKKGNSNFLHPQEMCRNKPHKLSKKVICTEIPSSGFIIFDHFSPWLQSFVIEMRKLPSLKNTFWCWKYDAEFKKLKQILTSQLLG